LSYVKPDLVHIFYEGRIVKSGNYSLAHEIEEEGYEKFEKAELHVKSKKGLNSDIIIEISQKKMNLSG